MKDISAERSGKGSPGQGDAMMKKRKSENSDEPRTAHSSFDRHKKRIAVLISVNLLVLLALALFPIYCDYMWYDGGTGHSVCLFRRLFKLYCPFCGVTRSVWYLMHADVVNALIFSPFAVTAAGAFIYCDIRAFVSVFKRRECVLYWSPVISRLLLGVLIASFILRNLLLIIFKYDPLGSITVSAFTVTVWNFLNA